MRQKMFQMDVSVIAKQSLKQETSIRVKLVLALLFLQTEITDELVDVLRIVEEEIDLLLAVRQLACFRIEAKLLR